MEQNEIRERIKKLRQLIDYHRVMYHTFDEPVVSDATFDGLRRELEKLEKEYPQFTKKQSPTEKVGGPVLKKFEKVTHHIPMLSLQDAFERDEINDWVTRLENYLKLEKKALTKLHYYCELKIDGLAIELVYEYGKLILASTRGDGVIGENVTQNVKMIESIPQTLSNLGTYTLPKNLTVRGEIFLTKEELERVNKEQETRGLKQYANTRNLAAGTLRQLDSQIVLSRRLQSFQYDIVGEVENVFKTHEEKHKALASWGFCVNEHNRRVNGLDGIFAFQDFWEKKREKLPYEIDGIVVILDNSKIFNELGSIGKTPRGAIAYKFAPREATTQVMDIRVQVGRTGVLTPVADLKPVSVGGTIITHATLHNADEIDRLGLKIGDTVIVSRAGDVIPKIIEVISDLRTGKEKVFKMPKRCPVDDSPVVVDGALHKCSNELCGARHKEMLYHFVSRKAFDLRGLGTKIIDRFLDEGLINDASDIFSLTKGDIEVLDRFGEKSAENIIREIHNKKEILQNRFLFSLGILHIGEETARVISERFPVSTIEELIKKYSAITQEIWEEVPDIGPKVSKSLFEWFHVKKNIDLLRKFENVKISLIPIKRKQGKFFGKIFVFTGTLEQMSREVAKEKVREGGGEVSESVSKETSYVVVGSDPGLKFTKAQKLKIPILNESEFLRIL